MSESTSLGNALRWIAFVPGACIAALLAQAAMRLLSRFSSFLGGENPDGFLSKLWLEVIANALMGAVFVYASARIAPGNRKHISYLMAVIAILIAGFLSFPAIVSNNWWALVGCIAMAMGGGLVAISAAEGELDLDTHRLS